MSSRNRVAEDGWAGGWVGAQVPRHCEHGQFGQLQLNDGAALAREAAAWGGDERTKEKQSPKDSEEKRLRLGRPPAS